MEHTLNINDNEDEISIFTARGDFTQNYSDMLTMNWSKHRHDELRALTTDEDGDIYLARAEYRPDDSEKASYDLSLLKINSSGEVAFNRTWDRSTVDSPEALAVDTETNSYVAGTLCDGSFYDIFIAKFDAEGHSVFNITRDSGNYEGVNAITLDSDNNIYIAGYNGTLSSCDSFLTVYDQSKEELLELTRNKGTGSKSYATALTVDENQTIYVAGAVENEGSLDAYIAVYTFSGTLIMNRTWDKGDMDIPRAIAVGESINGTPRIYLVGSTGEDSLDDAFLLVYDMNGSLDTEYVREESFQDLGKEISVDEKGGFCFSGTVSGGSRSIFLEAYGITGELIQNMSWDLAPDDGEFSEMVQNGDKVYAAGFYEGETRGFLSVYRINVTVPSPAFEDIASNFIRPPTTIPSWNSRVLTRMASNFIRPPTTIPSWNSRVLTRMVSFTDK
jgi:hypothetical protein